MVACPYRDIVAEKRKCYIYNRNIIKDPFLFMDQAFFFFNQGREIPESYFRG